MTNQVPFWNLHFIYFLGPPVPIKSFYHKKKFAFFCLWFFVVVDVMKNVFCPFTEGES